MKKSCVTLLLMTSVIFSCTVTKEKPNILFVISDDQSFPHASIYGTTWIKTPGFDRVAREGLLFTNAFTTNAKCSPCLLYTSDAADE